MPSDIPVVTSFIRHRGEVLLVRRSNAVGTYRGVWGAVSGYAPDDPDEQALREIHEEVGLAGSVTLVRAGTPFTVDAPEIDGRWIVHPYLFDSDSRAAVPNEEVREYEWISPTVILSRHTVPALWDAYRTVAPTVDTIRSDRTHGSTYLSIRGLEVLRDRAAELTVKFEPDPEAPQAANGDDATAWADLSALAHALLDARPSMAALSNRINRVMTTADEIRGPSGVEAAAIIEIERSFDADDASAENAAYRCANENVLMLSRSGTIIDALIRGQPSTVTVLESRPACEGIDVAEVLVEDGLDVTLSIDAAGSHLLSTRGVDVVLVGADTIFPDGAIINKVGTRSIAISAAFEDIPVYAVATTDKISPDESTDLEPGDPSLVYSGDFDIEVSYPTFDVTPRSLFEGVITEKGCLTPTEIAQIAPAHAALRSWSERTS